MNKDTVTTLLGGLMAAGTAAQPVLNATQGSMHQGDFIQLAIAVCMSLFGYFTNKTGTPAQP